MKKTRLGLSISFKITTSLLVLMTIFLFITAVLFQRALFRVMNEEKEARIQATATLLTVILTPSVEKKDYHAVTKMLEDVIAFPEVRYAFLADPDGELVAKASRVRFPRSFYTEVSRRSTMKTANTAGFNTASTPFSVTKVETPKSSLVSKGTLYDYSLPLAGGRLHVGQVSTLDLASLTAIMGSSIRFMVLLVPTALLVSALLLRRFLRPLHHLTEKAKEISMGNLGAKLPWDRGREVKELAIAIERMRISLKRVIGRDR